MSNPLIKSFLESVAKWPSQELRKTRYKHFLSQNIPLVLESSSPEKISKEIQALESLLNNDLERKYKLSDDSKIMSYLPAEKTYSLLDSYAQEAISKSNLGTWGFFGTYMKGQFKKKLHE